NALSGIYDLLLLDVMLPGMDGMSLLRAIREEGLTTPVIMLTAKGETADRVAGLDYGADDYVAKPFITEEPLARIRAALRRKGVVLLENTLNIGDMERNTGSLKLSAGGKEIKLILKERELMELLMSRRHAVKSKDQIIEKLWGFDSD